MEITLESGTSAILATPHEREATRGVVIIPDIMGLRPLFTDLSQTLADRYGWAVCCFELFAGYEHLELEERFVHAPSMVDERILGDAVAAAEVTDQPSVSIIGFCMGGMYALKAVGTGRFDCVCPFYGMIRVPVDWRGPDQGEPLDTIANGDPRSILAIVGGNDPYTPADDLDALEATGATVVRYADAEHGFVHDAERPAHRAHDADDAWRRVSEFVNAH